MTVTLTTPASEDEMITVFLRAGRDSPREAAALTAVVDRLSLSWEHLLQPAHQKARARVLADWFGWGQYESVFGGMPNDIHWWWGYLSRADLREHVFSIRWHFEDVIGTRRVAELAVVWPPDDVVEAIMTNVRAGRCPEPPILLTTPTSERLVILEGHTRLVTYMARADEVPFPLLVMVGTSDRIAEWSEW